MGLLSLEVSQQKFSACSLRLGLFVFFFSFWGDSLYFTVLFLFFFWFALRGSHAVSFVTSSPAFLSTWFLEGRGLQSLSPALIPSH